MGDGPGRQDGATVDADGFVWNAHIFAGRVVRYDPHGRIEREIEVPTSRVTSCAFGGRDLNILYITTASMRISKGRSGAVQLPSIRPTWRERAMT